MTSGIGGRRCFGLSALRSMRSPIGRGARRSAASSSCRRARRSSAEPCRTTRDGYRLLRRARGLQSRGTRLCRTTPGGERQRVPPPCLADAAGRHRRGRDAARSRHRASSTRRPASAPSRCWARLPDWLSYDIPTPLAGLAWKGRYSGQTQKWLAFRFTGEDSEIDVDAPGGGRHKPEFGEWRWERLERVPDLIVPFKRDVYEKVARSVFAPFAEAARAASGRGAGAGSSR